MENMFLAILVMAVVMFIAIAASGFTVRILQADLALAKRDIKALTDTVTELGKKVNGHTNKGANLEKRVGALEIPLIRPPKIVMDISTKLERRPLPSHHLPPGFDSWEKKLKAIRDEVAKTGAHFNATIKSGKHIIQW